MRLRYCPVPRPKYPSQAVQIRRALNMHTVQISQMGGYHSRSTVSLASTLDCQPATLRDHGFRSPYLTWVLELAVYAYVSRIVHPVSAHDSIALPAVPLPCELLGLDCGDGVVVWVVVPAQEGQPQGVAVVDDQGVQMSAGRREAEGGSGSSVEGDQLEQLRGEGEEAIEHGVCSWRLCGHRVVVRSELGRAQEGRLCSSMLCSSLPVQLSQPLSLTACSMAKRATLENGSAAEDSDAATSASTSVAAPSKKRVKASNGGKSSKGKQRAVEQEHDSDAASDDGDNAGQSGPDEDDLDLGYNYRSAGESTDSAGGSEFDDAEYSESGKAASSKSNGKSGKGPGKTRAKGTSSSARGIVLSSASKELYTQAATQPGTVARMPPGVSDTSSLVSALFPGQGDAAYLPLKPDHLSRPLYIAPSYPPYIILEAFHPLSLQAQDFLTAIAEPVSRPKHVHEYKLTKHSLYAAVSIGLEPEDIIGVLSRLSKVKIPPETIEYIREATKSFGKVRLVLKDTKYYVESGYPDTLRLLLRDKIIADARATEEGQSGDLETATAPKKSSLVIPGTKYAGAGAAGEHVTDGGVASEPAPGAEGSAAHAQEEDGLFTAFVGLDADEEAEDDDNVHRFQIKADEMENVKKRCNDLEYPMLQEYDFRADSVNPNLEIALKPATQIRPYQEKSLRKMFSNE